MAYVSVSNEVASNASDSDDTSGSSPPQNDQSFRPISMNFSNLGGSNFMGTAETTSSRPTSSRVGSIIQSLAPSLKTDYSVVENDDYSPVKEQKAGRSESPEPTLHSPTADNPIPLRHPVPDLQSLQGAYVGNVERLEMSAERLSMKSDIGEELRKMKLEQRQVEQQESTAEEGVANRRSSASLSNSIVDVNTAARSGGYSPAGYVSSRGSIGSNSSAQQGGVTRGRGASVASRLERVPEPEEEAQDNMRHRDIPEASIQPPVGPASQSQSQNMLEPGQDHLAIERPTTAGSTDTYRQAAGLFGDFDGVHFSPGSREPQHSRRISLNKPPLAGGSQAYREPPPGEDMVYYPAPVPMMLNLPQRLSKQPPVSEREKRRTKVISSVPAEARKSAAWLQGEQGSSEDVRRSARMSTLPPQLRASVFFEQTPAQLDVEVTHDSAVSTLDNILDASAKAPVSAFTDHPIVGHVGAEVYGKAKIKKPAKVATPPVEKEKEKRKRLSKPMDPRHSRLFFGNHSSSDIGKSDSGSKATPPRLSHEGTSMDEHDHAHHDDTVDSYRTGSYRDHDDRYEGERDDDYDSEETSDSEEDEDDDEEEEEEEEEVYVGQPTTLLAELHLRKQEHKQRTKAAAVAYPNGMHSTLLQLDAVRQIQHNTRRHRHVTLAWEAPENPDQSNGGEEDDEDVPLGVLFPDNKKVVEETRPLGLMEKREMEENEPLSKRRARLRGEPPPSRARPEPARQSVAHTLDMPLGDEEVSEDEEETLAQRVRRLKGEEKRKSIFGDDFASEIMSQLGGKLGDTPTESKPPPEPEPEPEEETLGQRRKRLQAEARAAGGGDNPASTVKARRSMADILQAHPASGVRGSQFPHNQRLNSLQPGNRLSTVVPTYPMTAPSEGPFQAQPAAYPSFGPTAYGNGMNYVAPMYNQASMNGFGYGTGHYVQESMMRAQQFPEETIDPKQRDMIDRWRQSVRQ
ncbi:hypothetical protein FQN54_005768 [Arachnomyces sp. PD_36]|nr:hypothetical protein FQN54_005768 [Arachnomyces sp. PD_36]